MSDLNQQIANLSPENRELFELMLQKRDADISSAKAILRRKNRNQAPLSFAQKRLFFLDQLESDSTAYNIPLALHLQGTLQVEALHQALNAIVSRHEALRTTFDTNEGQPFQIIKPSLALNLPVEDISILPEIDRVKEAQRLAAEETQHPFDLAQGPLLRATLLHFSDQEHVLLLTMHHIISDGWSLGLFNRELGTLYTAFCFNQPSPLPDLPIQYADFAVWQQKWLQGEVLKNELSYWKHQLAGMPPLLELSTDRPRPTLQSFCGTQLSIPLSAELSATLKTLSRREGVTFFMTLLAAFQTLLLRYTGQEDIVVGSPIANRTRSEIEGLIGFFVNTLVLRTDLSGNPSFRDLLHRVREVALDAYTHQELPFEKLVEELQPERNLSYSPLIQVMFSLQNMPGPTLELHDLTVNSLEIDNGTAKFDLSLFILETDEGLRALFEYNTDLFDETTIHRMLGHYQALLKGIAADPEQPIGTLPLLTEAERHQLLMEWNDTNADYPGNKCIHELFEQQVAKRPDSVAVVFEDQHLTYRELNQRANRLAYYLRTLDVGRDSLVGIHVERSLEMIVGLLGIMKVGGGFLPLDPFYPSKRLAFMLEDAGPEVVLTQKKLKNRLSGMHSRVICLEDCKMPVIEDGLLSFDDGPKPSDRAYVLYTSGSTGKPKGVQVPHRAVVNFLISMSQEPGLGRDDVVLAVTTLSFDIHVLEIFLPLIVGARVVIVGHQTAADGDQLLKTLNESQATLMQATPSTWRLLIAAGWKGNQNLKVLCGGEAFPRDLSKMLLSRSRRVWNMYGPTETTVWSSCCRITNSDGPIQIGRPIANTRMYVLDRLMQPVPIGVPGELYIGGDGVTQGYLDRPDLTEKQFVPDPFQSDHSARLYKTGDLVRFHTDGNVEYLSRIDTQVKVRGFRIELGEIESVLSDHPSVGKCVATVREDKPGDARLLAHIVCKPGKEVAVVDLKSYLRSRLPDYMVPQHFIELERLPLTLAGKIDRKNLPAPEYDDAMTALEYIAPRNETEELLADIWQDLSSINRVGIYENFFDIGGNSLLALQLISRINQTFELQLPLRQLFNMPTISELAMAIENCLYDEINSLSDEEAEKILNAEKSQQ